MLPSLAKSNIKVSNSIQTYHLRKIKLYVAGCSPADNNLWLRAVILVRAMGTPNEDLFEQARIFHDSHEACYKKDHPTSYGTLHPDYARSCRCYCPSTVTCGRVGLWSCWVGGKSQGSSNFVAASSLRRLHRAVAMSAAMVTSVPWESPSPPGLRRGCGGIFR